MQAQRSIQSRPRRAAATVALQRIRDTAQTGRRGRGGQQQQQQQQPPHAIVNPNQDVNGNQVTTCPLCQGVIRPDQDLERCQACLTWVHHDCVQPHLEPFDWSCRGLCGYPDVHQQRQQCPLNNCGQPFRLTSQANEARWVALLNTRMWRRHARRPHPTLTLIYPPCAPASPWYLDRLRPRARWWLARTPAVSNLPERRILDPHTANVQWNQAGHPKRLHNNPYFMFVGWTNPLNQAGSAAAAYFRHLKIFVQPRLPYNEDHRFQRWVFADLNVMMHSRRRIWRRMCKYYDDHSITVADMRDM